MAVSSSIWVLLIAAVAILSLPVEAEGTLFNGEKLLTNQFLENGPYKFIMQGDCNLVLYKNSKALWASRTEGNGNSCYLFLQDDGNLVIFSGSKVRSSRSTRVHNSYRFVTQTDGNVVIYGGAIWATNTSKKRTANSKVDPSI